jgi:starvation-inducible outer membrane lipoprotein
MKREMLLVVVVLLAQGCTYAISPDLAAQADKTLPFSRLADDPSLYQGTLVILGGTIAKTALITEHTSMIEVEQKQLDHWGKPLSRSSSGGRFLVRSTWVLSPQVYTPGREITVAAVVEGISRQGIDDTSSSFPVVLLREIKLWPREPSSWGRPSYMDPLLYDPYAISPGY